MKDILLQLQKYAGKLNKYVVAIVFFTVVTFCWGDHTIVDRIKTKREISDLKRDIDYYKKENEANKIKIDALTSDDEVLEKYAREELLMVKPDEEVFIIKD